MRLTKINTILLASIIIVNGYTIVAPALPAFTFRWQNLHNKRQQLQQEINPGRPNHSTSRDSFGNTNQTNHIIIPSIFVNEAILEGSVSNQYKILDQGIWRWPAGSSPNKGGNTVLIGHRFTYTNPRGVFYFLNKVKLGDDIGLFWNGHKYLYKVARITVVPPNDIAIESNTQEAELTLFTCTPLWLPKDRLVVVANLMQKS